MLEAADRQARVLAGARKEGVVAIYTSLNTQDSVPLTAAFEKKYGVKTQLWRSSSERVVQRAVAEARAGRFTCDVFETNGPEMEALYREQLLEEFRSPSFRRSAAGGVCEAPPLRRRPLQLLHHRLQHASGEAGGSARFLQRPAAPAVRRPDRHRGGRRRLVRRDGQAHGRAERPRLLPEAGGGEAADAERPHAGGAAHRLRRDSDRGEHLQPQRRARGGPGRADQVEGADADVRPSQRDRPVATRARIRTPALLFADFVLSREGQRFSRRATACRRAARSTRRSTRFRSR